MDVEGVKGAVRAGSDWASVSKRNRGDTNQRKENVSKGVRREQEGNQIEDRDRLTRKSKQREPKLIYKGDREGGLVRDDLRESPEGGKQIQKRGERERREKERSSTREEERDTPADD